jgi:hypothetical protein
MFLLHSHGAFLKGRLPEGHQKPLYVVTYGKEVVLFDGAAMPFLDTHNTDIVVLVTRAAV